MLKIMCRVFTTKKILAIPSICLCLISSFNTYEYVTLEVQKVTKVATDVLVPQQQQLLSIVSSIN
jgi:hypothetical protein